MLWRGQFWRGPCGRVQDDDRVNGYEVGQSWPNDKVTTDSLCSIHLSQLAQSGFFIFIFDKNKQSNWNLHTFIYIYKSIRFGTPYIWLEFGTVRGKMFPCSRKLEIAIKCIQAATNFQKPLYWYFPTTRDFQDRLYFERKELNSDFWVLFLAKTRRQ